MIAYDDLEPSEKVKVYDKGVSFTDDRRRSRKCASVTVPATCGRRSSTAPRRLRVEGEHFVDCINHAKVPQTDGNLGLRVVEIIEAATNSMRPQARARPSTFRNAQ